MPIIDDRDTPEEPKRWMEQEDWAVRIPAHRRTEFIEGLGEVLERESLVLGRDVELRIIPLDSKDRPEEASAFLATVSLLAAARQVNWKRAALMQVYDFLDQYDSRKMER